MDINVFDLNNASYRVFKARYEMDLIYKLGAVVIFAALTGFMAQIRIYLPFTPVPITGQVLPALLAGFALGKWYGGFSQILYAVIGVLWIPWFAPKAGNSVFSSGGIEVLLGPTGGYIAGFAMAAFMIGYLTDTYISSRRLLPQIFIMLTGVMMIYLVGATQFYLVAKSTPPLKEWILNSLGSNSLGIKEVLLTAVIPFIPGDIMKALLAAGLGSVFLPKTSFAAEKDA